MSLLSLWEEAALLDGPKDMVLLSELQNYCQMTETPVLPEGPIQMDSNDPVRFLKHSKTKAAYTFKIL
jgi:hypothetical protein